MRVPLTSAAAYDGSPAECDHVPVMEEKTADSSDPYGRSKFACAALLRSIAPSATLHYCRAANPDRVIGEVHIVETAWSWLRSPDNPLGRA